MRIFGFGAGNRGSHDCRGHHWHMAMSGWRCCGCTDTYPAGDRPDSAAVECRLGVQDGRHHLQREDPESAAWLAELMSPAEDTGELPGLGRRRLAAGAGQMVRAVARVPRWAGGRPPGNEVWQPRHRAGKG